MANIRVHYQINDFQLQDESNFTGNNFVFRMDTPNVPFGLPDGNLGINTDYKVYKSKQDMIDGFSPFKLYANGKRIVNFLNFSLEPWDNEFSTNNFTDVHKQIISDYFGVPLDKITVVVEQI